MSDPRQPCGDPDNTPPDVEPLEEESPCKHRTLHIHHGLCECMDCGHIWEPDEEDEE